MDRMEMMDAEGGRVVQRPRRAGGRLAVVVAVQNVLVVACLVLTVYVYWEFQSKTSSDDFVHIQFDPITVQGENVTLRFSQTFSNKSIELSEKKDKMHIKCTGPYILYMYVCCSSLNKKEEAQGTLQLQVNGSSVSSVLLQASGEVCRGLHSIAYLRAKEKASLHLYSSHGFRISNVTVGLSYLLGKRCDD